MLCIEVIQHSGSLRLSNQLIQCLYLDLESATSFSTAKKTAKYFVERNKINKDVIEAQNLNSNLKELFRFWDSFRCQSEIKLNELRAFQTEWNNK